MAFTTAVVSWKRSPSSDAKTNIVRFFVDGEEVDSIEVGAGVETVTYSGLEEGRLFKVTVTVSDGVNESGPVSTEAVVPDVTAPEPITDLAIAFNVQTE